MNAQYPGRDGEGGRVEPGEGRPDPGPAAAPGDASPAEAEALREALRASVGDLRPASDALPYLRQAIPARRARRRQALVGAAAAVVLAGVGASALVSGFVPGVSGSDQPTEAASGEPGGHGPGGSPSGSEHAGADSGGADSEGEETDGKDGGGKGDEKGSAEPSEGRESGGTESGGTDPDGAPACDRGQLGSGSAVAGEPDGQGRVYGTFRVVNTSDSACAVRGGGTVQVAAQGRAGNSQINVQDHQGGGAAPALPDPGESVERLVLEPGSSYVVRFAWVPQADGGSSCQGIQPSPGTSGSEGGEAPGPGVDGGTDTGGETGGSGGPNDGGGSGGPDNPDNGAASITVRHTPDGGGPVVANTTVPGACSGTVYRTGVLPGS
ncbi:DUF4232 domain-containing protein [Streptomyces sp. AJS327]|uniref:DUF4232 domain-containing protein n=1 Tax=Streptomyces sp. AJS327 TaxID=2545265 RepID=UPI0015DE76E8|nr:DUF4232 domain-containing protein [Streptomyces sp. AJS327]